MKGHKRPNNAKATNITPESKTPRTRNTPFLTKGVVTVGKFSTCFSILG